MHQKLLLPKVLNFLSNYTNMLTVYVSTEYSDFNHISADIRFPENSTHPVKQVEYIENLFNTNDYHNHSIITNSPYILQAIRYYAAKYGVEKNVVYYNVIDDNMVDISSTLNNIFTSFAVPLNSIMNVDQVRKMHGNN